jgi:hypothetical protein
VASHVLAQTFVIAALSLGCTSCATIHDEYPSGWPLLDRIDPNCSRVAGTYRERGTGLEGLSDKFFGDTGEIRDYVDISYSPNAVEVTSISAGQPRSVKTFTTQGGDFHCANGRVELSLSRGCRACPGATYEKLKLTLVRADDDSLIVRTEGSGAYLVLYVVPAGSTISTWDRYFPR